MRKNVLALYTTAVLLFSCATKSISTDGTSADNKTAVVQSAPDLGDTYLAAAAAHGAARWPAKRIPITCFIDVNPSIPGYRESYKAAIDAAMKAWTEASGGKITFTPGDVSSASIQVKWTDDVKNMNFAQEMGHTEIQVDGDGLYKATMILLTKQHNGSTIDDTFATHVAMHEFGHALGILGHSTSPDDVMFPTTTPTQSAALSKKDIGTIVTLYSSAGEQFLKKFDPVKMTDFGPGANAGLRAMHLNAEAGELLKKGEYAAAIAKLEEALKLDPNNQMVLSNLGATYGNVASMAFMMQKPKDADNYFKKSIATLDKCKDPKPLLPILMNYSTVLKNTGRLDEANKIDARIRQLSGGQAKH